MTHHHKNGFGAGTVFAFVLALIALGLISRYGYIEYRRNYWDERVKEMCAKDGGVKVFERVALTDKRYLDSDRNIRIPSKFARPPGYGRLNFEAKPDDLYYKKIASAVIRSDHPSVVRDDVRVFRSSDGKLLGQATYFGRVGSEFIAIDFESRFRCPTGGESTLLKEIFIVEPAQGANK